MWLFHDGRGDNFVLFINIIMNFCSFSMGQCSEKILRLWLNARHSELDLDPKFHSLIEHHPSSLPLSVMVSVIPLNSSGISSLGIDKQLCNRKYESQRRSVRWQLNLNLVISSVWVLLISSLIVFWVPQFTAESVNMAVSWPLVSRSWFWGLLCLCGLFAKDDPSEDPLPFTADIVTSMQMSTCSGADIFPMLVLITVSKRCPSSCYFGCLN